MICAWASVRLTSHLMSSILVMTSPTADDVIVDFCRKYEICIRRTLSHSFEIDLQQILYDCVAVSRRDHKDLSLFEWLTNSYVDHYHW